MRAKYTHTKHPYIYIYISAGLFAFGALNYFLFFEGPFHCNQKIDAIDDAYNASGKYCGSS